MSGVTRITNEVPFGQALHLWLHLHELPITQFIDHDRVEQAYLAWETVRLENNPYFEHGTGFEGYFVGRCDDAEEALEAILAISQHILDAIARMYRFEIGLRTRLIKTLRRELYDPEAIHIWSSYFGAELGRLRMQVILEPEAQHFQIQTYRIIQMLPPIIYTDDDHDVMQSYSVASLPMPHLNKLDITPAVLNADQQEAWLVAENIGIFGHPLVRKCYDRA